MCYNKDNERERGTGPQDRWEHDMGELMGNVDYILRNRDEFRVHYADIIAKFERLGIERRMAEAMAITLVAKVKTVNDMLHK